MKVTKQFNDISTKALNKETTKWVLLTQDSEHCDSGGKTNWNSTQLNLTIKQTRINWNSTPPQKQPITSERERAWLFTFVISS